MDQVINLSISQLQPNPLQPRGLITPESLVELVDSIREHGILEPLIVAHTPVGYQIIAGERRWRAAKLAGLTQVPVIVRETTPRGMLEMALVENVQRADLNALERAKAFERLIREFGMTPSEISSQIAKSLSFVSNTMRLLGLPDAIKDGLLSGLISEGHARALMGIKDPRLMIEAYKIILSENASVRRAEDLARRMGQKLGQAIGVKQERLVKRRLSVDKDIDGLARDLSQAIDGNEVQVVQSTRQTKIVIKLSGSPKDTEPYIRKLYTSLVGKELPYNIGDKGKRFRGVKSS